MIAEIHNLGTISANSGEAPEQRDATEVRRCCPWVNAPWVLQARSIISYSEHLNTTAKIR